MQISPKIKKQLRWQNNLFVLLFLIIVGLLAWLSLEYDFESDWTNNKRNTPNEVSLALLEKIEEPITIQAFVSNTNQALTADIKHLINGYQRYKSNITLTFIDPTREPTLIRKIGVRNEGELLVEILDRQEHILAPSEQNLTNAIQRLARTQENWILFLEGHDERSPYGDSNFDYSSWNAMMKSKGLLTRTYNLASNPNIPVNTAALVIADPQKPLLVGEIEIIQEFLDGGGNLLWLLEPGDLQNMDTIAEMLGVETIQGMVVDPNTQLLGINDPRFTLIPEYPRNDITQGLDSLTVFPTSQAIEFFGNEEWDAETLLETLPRTWSETDEVSSEMTLDSAQDIPGPLVIGLSLTRSPQSADIDNIELDTNEQDDLPEFENDNTEEVQNQQRVVIIGDSDFNSDAYIGQAGNLDFAMSIINWLVKNDSFISIPHRVNTDISLELNKSEQLFIGLSFLLFIPLGLLLTGLFIWFRRRKS